MRMNVLCSRWRTVVTRLGRVEEVIRQQQMHPLNQAQVEVQLDFLDAIGTDCQRLEKETLSKARDNQIPGLEEEVAAIIGQFTNAKTTLLLFQQSALVPQVAPVQHVLV